jgi:hypothetical protein
MTSSLETALGDRIRTFQCAWKIQEPGRDGFVALEEEDGSVLFSFYLLVEGAWNRLSFRRIKGIISIYQDAVSESIVAVATGKGNARHLLQLIVAVEGGFCWWSIYWQRYGRRILLASVQTHLDPFVAYI